MKKKNLLTMATALALSVTTMMSGIPVNAAENDETVATILGKEIALTNEINLETYDESIATLNIMEADATGTENEPSTIAGIGLRYLWNYGTYPYDFAAQKWSTDKNIYDTYASTGEEEYLNPKFTYLLLNPTGPISYQEAIREGYLREDGELQLYDHVVSSTSSNNVLMMLDDDVVYDIWEKDTLNSVFSGSSTALIGGTTDTQTIDGRHKTLINVQLKNGEYLIIFGINTVTDKNHYALYTGCPLPMQKTSMVSGTHKGTVYWNGGGLKAETEKECPAVSLSVPSGVDPGLFALSRVYFEDYSVAGAQDLYVSDVTYYYTSPGNLSYKILSKVGDTFYDNTPSTCSVQGTYKTKFRVTWDSNLSYVGAYYNALTMMYVDYMIPYGLYEGM